MTSDQYAETIRPLWRRIVDFPLVAMVSGVALFVATTMLPSLAFRHLPDMAIAPASRKMLLGLVVAGLVILMYKFAISKLGETPHDDLRGERAVRDLGLGLVAGTLLFSLVAGIAGAVGVYDIVGVGSPRSLLFALVTVGIVPAVIEELLFRGIMFRHLEDFGGSWFALALTSALFGVAHFFNPNATVFSSFAISIEAGLLLGGAYLLTRSLWAPIGLHAAWNFTQSQLFDVPVSGVDGTGLVQAKLSGPELLSGGAFGLEASVIAIIFAAGAGLWLLIRAERAGNMRRPWWLRRRRTSDGARLQKAVRIDVDRDPDL